MHPIPTREIPVLSDWWAPGLDELDRLAATLLGATPEGWVRRTSRETTIADRFLALDARLLAPAVSELAKLTSRVRTDARPQPGLRAAAYYHLRFENIHPLTDGNGRVGRLILAAQCEQAVRIPIPEFLSSLHDFENEYKWVFRPTEQSQRYELLVDLLAQITGTILDPDAINLTVPLEAERPLPLHKQRKGA